MEYRDFLRQAAHVVPSQRQLRWYDMEFYAFVHFTVNTYTDLEWGHGDEPESIFNPVELDCDSWVEAVKSAGMKGIILTAKHHDGFCLWPTKTTEHCVRNSPWKNGQGDVVKECADACRRGGIKFGVYLSPWDRNAPQYGTDAYNDFYCEQLTELLTGYGELFEVWFDNACGEGPSGKKQVYDFPRYVELIRKYQPNAVIYNDHGPDVRWCGNEAGSARRAEWAVVPHELCFHAEKQTGAGPMAGDLSWVFNWDECIGDLPVIQYSRGLAFCGAEIDMSIRPGWFYHENQEPRSLERLFNTYLHACGANTGFNLNVPPMPNGKFNDKDVARLKELGQAIRNAFGEEKVVPCTVEKLSLAEDKQLASRPMYAAAADGATTTANSDTQCLLRLHLSEKVKVAYVRLRENIAVGQRVEGFRILQSGQPIYRGYTIGNNLLCPVTAETDTLDILITSARDTVDLREITVYRA